MRRNIYTLSVLLILGGCQVVDENTEWNPPSEYASWTYDAPFYYRPSQELPVAETIGDGIPVYYTSNPLFFVKHPTGYQPPREPRVSLWCSLDRGENWARGGFFGVEQTHFLYQSDSDGPHWIRFVGPSQDPIKSSPGKPHRIYVVDTTPPSIELSLDPPPVERDEEGNVTGLHIYSVQEPVTLRWNVRDANLDPESIRVSTTFTTRPEEMTWTAFPKEYAPSGEDTVPVPPEAAAGDDGGVMRFRMEARDRAGNVNFVLSELMYVGKVGGLAEPLKPVPPTPLTAQSHGAPGEMPGWPETGELIRGGTSRILDWMPAEAQKHEHVVLQFSANNGRSWRTVAENVQFGKRVKWTVPEVNSKICRLRLVAIADKDRKIMLACSLPFTVHTAPATIDIGPKELPPEPL